MHDRALSVCERNETASVQVIAQCAIQMDQCIFLSVTSFSCAAIEFLKQDARHVLTCQAKCREYSFSLAQ